MPQARIRLRGDLSELVALETFIGGLGFLPGSERARCLLVATETFDNIARYGSLSPRARVLVSVRVVGGHVEFRFRYPTDTFSELLSAVHTTKPRYDREARRYRGLGLRMCSNLSSSIAFRRGLFKALITIIL